MAQPNIILVTCDQLRAFEVGCYGNSVIRTPNLDRLAAQGVRFATVVSNNPVCTPARSCLLSGQFSRTCAGSLGNQAWDPPTTLRRRLVQPTLPEELRGAGYRTALIGKWHIDPSPMITGFDQATWPLIIHRYRGQRYFIDGRRETVVEGFGPEWELEQVEQFLDAPGERPFFLFYSISPPHEPIGTDQFPSRYTGLYEREQVPLRPNVFRDGRMAHDLKWFKIYQHWGYWWRIFNLGAEPHYEGYPRGGSGATEADVLPEDFDLRDLTALYYAATTCVDDLVGRLMAMLEERGLARNTLVVFTSDHGDNLGSHQRFNKGLLIEESIRVPLMIRWPEQLPPAVNMQQVAQLVDVMPTILDLAGIAPPGHVQGRSLAPLLWGERAELVENHAIIETDRSGTGHPCLGIRTPTHLYGAHLDQATGQLLPEPWGFFDLAADPYEMHNLAGTGEQSELAAELRRRLVQWNAQTPWLQVQDAGRGH